jgi:hypothetical protein
MLWRYLALTGLEAALFVEFLLLALSGADVCWGLVVVFSLWRDSTPTRKQPRLQLAKSPKQTVWLKNYP